MKFHPGFLAGKGAVSIYKHIVDVGADSQLFQCLDFGISECHSAGSQTLHDLAGSTDFWNGVDGTATFDATFFGTAGDGTAAEYFSVGLPGIMTAKGSTFWSTNDHINGGRFTVMVVAEFPGGGSGGPSGVIFSTNGNSNTAIGVTAAMNGDRLALKVANGTGLAYSGSSTITAPAGFSVAFIAIDENVIANGSHWRINSNSETFVSSYTSPSSSAQSQTTTLFTGSQVPFRCAAFAAWSRDLSVGETQSIYDAVKTRWGL